MTLDKVLNVVDFDHPKKFFIKVNKVNLFFAKYFATSIKSWEEPLILLPFTLGMAAILLWQKRRLEALTFVLAIGGSLALNIGLKELFARHRPTLWDQIMQVPFYSFPSGHAMVSIVFYAVLIYGLIRQFRPFQLWILTVGTGLIVAIGFSRLYIGVHWPTDVIAGYAAGLVWLTVCFMLQSVLLAWRRKPMMD